MLIFQISNLYSIHHYENSILCYNLVKKYAESYWQNRQKNESYENYRFDDNSPKHALGNMLLNNDFYGGYSIVYYKENPISFGGIRKYTEDIAIVLARNFCFFTVKPITNGIMLPFQIKYAKFLGFKKAWTTVNQHNIGIFDVWYKQEYSKRLQNRRNKRTDPIYIESDRCIADSINIGKKIVNHVEQTVVEWDLKEHSNEIP